MLKPQSNKSKAHKIALYIRVSTEEQAENPEGSIRNQEERLRAAVGFKNMEDRFGEIADVFIDRARSGKDTNRPELQRLLGAIRRGEIDLVMVSELSRLSRSIKDFSGIWELMRAHGCGFYSLRENFDTTTAAGEMVLYTVANIAQFERRQTSERVSANFQARAQRGLYNGGVLPLGYKLIADKPGFLDVDEEASEVVKMAFKAFLKEGTLSRAAKWLNTNGYKVKRETMGGNHRPRLGHFTVDNLHQILRNKSYIGVRVYKQKGEEKEAKAVWPALVDIRTYNDVQAQLKANHCRKKPPGGNRYPFMLTGLVKCQSCNASLVGKSAHGNGGKISYYEHSWATKKLSCVVKPTFDCKPFRIQAKKLEPMVWEKAQELLCTPGFAEDLISGAHLLHKERSKSSESKRIKEKLQSLEGQMEVLASRLAELPKSISPAPIFKQMEKLEQIKAEEQSRLTQAQLTQVSGEMPTSLKKYEALLGALRVLASQESSTDVREKVIRALVNRIMITPDGFEVQFHAGNDYIDREIMNHWEEPDLSDYFASQRKSISLSSTSLTNGGPTRT